MPNRVTVTMYCLVSHHWLVSILLVHNYKQTTNFKQTICLFRYIKILTSIRGCKAETREITLRPKKIRRKWSEAKYMIYRKCAIANKQLLRTNKIKQSNNKNKQQQNLLNNIYHFFLFYFLSFFFLDVYCQSIKPIRYIKGFWNFITNSSSRMDWFCLQWLNKRFWCTGNCCKPRVFLSKWKKDIQYIKNNLITTVSPCHDQAINNPNENSVPIGGITY
jgi:hypothetical protein